MEVTGAMEVTEAMVQELGYSAGEAVEGLGVQLGTAALWF
jgi:hypothetical protein